MSITILGQAGEFEPDPIPFFLESVPAGFPLPTAGYEESPLDLNQLVIARPASTYLLRVDGDSMKDIGIYSGDMLAVDRSLNANHGDVVIACVDGEFTVKTLETKPVVRLVPANMNYKPILIQEGTELQVFGVVTFVLRSIRKS